MVSLQLTQKRESYKQVVKHWRLLGISIIESVYSVLLQSCTLLSLVQMANGYGTREYKCDSEVHIG